MFIKVTEKRVTIHEAIAKYQDGVPVYLEKEDGLKQAESLKEIHEHYQDFFIKEKNHYGIYELTQDETNKIKELGLNVYEKNIPFPLELYVRDFMQDQLGMYCAMDGLSEEETDEVIGKVHELSALFIESVNEDEITQYLNDRILEFLMKKKLL